MATILLSIKKIYSDRIFCGNKKYEYRKTVPSNDIDRILVYESKGSGKIIGELIISDIITGAPSEIWEMTSKESGVTEDEFFTYFAKKDFGIAFSIKSYNLFDPPRSLEDYGIKAAPQNYVYINVSTD